MNLITIRNIGDAIIEDKNSVGGKKAGLHNEPGKINITNHE